jgi:hypothetical protein
LMVLLENASIIYRYNYIGHISCLPKPLIRKWYGAFLGHILSKISTKQSSITMI